MASEELRRMAEGEIEIRRLEGGALVQTARFSARRFGFSEADQIPPWLLHTMVWAGGLVLGAFDGERLIGYSVGFPGFRDGESFLMGVAVAVDPSAESRGVGTALMTRQGELALEAGYQVFKGTVGSVASRALFMHVNKVGERIIGVVPDMYVTTRPDLFPDELEVRWDLQATPRSPREPSNVRVLTRTVEVEGGLRRLVGADDDLRAADDETAFLVEIPWDSTALLKADEGAAGEWSRQVRASVQKLVGAGYEGTRVRTDARERRTWVVFERGRPLG